MGTEQPLKFNRGGRCGAASEAAPATVTVLLLSTVKPTSLCSLGKASAAEVGGRSGRESVYPEESCRLSLDQVNRPEVAGMAPIGAVITSSKRPFVKRYSLSGP